VKNYTRLNLLANPGPSRDIEEDFMAKGTAGAESAPPATGGAATARVDLKNKCLKNQSNKESCSNRSGRQSKKPPYLHNRIILQEIFRVARDGRG
jgi:hypothetical protein